MQGVLLLNILNVRSSYTNELELPLGGGEVPDTLQWWIAPGNVWRIRTYALDHDIHTHHIGAAAEEFAATATENTRKHFGDVLGAEYTVVLPDCTDPVTVVAAFQRIGLPPNLEVSSGRFAFWTPDTVRYATKSTPR